jgi:tetratricopeptide (TPR) repeat protein
MKRKQGNKTIKLLSSMVIVKQTSAIYQILGEAYLLEGVTNKAIKAFNDSIRLGNSSKSTTQRQLAEKHEGLGNAFQQKQQETNDSSWSDKTVNALKKSIEYDPTHISAHFNLISVYKQAGQHEKALELIKKTAEITPDSMQGWISLGKIFLENKEIPKSSFAFKRAVETSTNQGQAFFEIGDIYDAFDTVVAKKYLVRANKISPNQFHILNKLGIVSRKLGNIEDSLTYYQQALEVENADEKLHFNLACAYLKNKETNSKEKGRFHLEKALEISPDFKEAKELLVKLS